MSSPERSSPVTGGIRVAWFSNLDAIEGRLPSTLLSVVGPPLTLKQGKFEVADQFWYSGRILEDGAIGPYFAAFRKAFAIGGMVCMDGRPQAAHVHHAEVRRPDGVRRPVENWKDHPQGNLRRTFTIVTGEPNEPVAPIHNQMPVILRPQDYGIWLGEKLGDVPTLMAARALSPAERMRRTRSACGSTVRGMTILPSSTRRLV